MSFRIKRGESVRHAVGRVAAEELVAARREAADTGRPLDDRVHGVRVHLKRARAALRLVRARAGRRVRRDERALRDAGRSLARARDAAIARAMLRELGAVVRAPRGSARDQADLTKAVAAIGRVRVGPGHPIAVRRDGHAARQAFVRGYRAARRGLRHLRPDDTPERFHAWRKLIKRLALQAHLFERVAPALSLALQEPLDLLAEKLGELHDLAVVEAELSGPRGTRLVPDDAARSTLLTRLRERTAAQRTRARALGAQVLAPRTRDLRTRLDKQWRE